jgi:hypothetical protein
MTGSETPRNPAGENVYDRKLVISIWRCQLLWKGYNGVRGGTGVFPTLPAS